jgi:hypothetical protein
MTMASPIEPLADLAAEARAIEDRIRELREAIAPHLLASSTDRDRFYLTSAISFCETSQHLLLTVQAKLSNAAADRAKTIKGPKLSPEQIEELTRP